MLKLTQILIPLIRTKIILSEATKYRPVYNRLVFGIGITLDENGDSKYVSTCTCLVDHGGKYEK